MKIILPIACTNVSPSILKKAVEISKNEDCILQIISFIKENDLREYKRNTRLWRQVDGSIISGRDYKLHDEIIARKIEREVYSKILQLDLDIADINFEIKIIIGKSNKQILNIEGNNEINLIITDNDNLYTDKFSAKCCCL
jgi:hypothetical protein